MRLRNCCVAEVLCNSLQAKAKTKNSKKKTKTIILNLYLFFSFSPKTILQATVSARAYAKRWDGKLRLVRIFLFRAFKYATKQHMHAYNVCVCGCVSCAIVCSCVLCVFTWHETTVDVTNLKNFLNASNYFGYA